MFGEVAFLVGGHMCCGVIGKDLVVRVGSDGYESERSVREGFDLRRDTGDRGPGQPPWSSQPLAR